MLSLEGSRQFKPRIELAGEGLWDVGMIFNLVTSTSGDRLIA